MDGMYLCSVDYVRVKDGFNINFIELGYFCIMWFFNEEIFVCLMDNKMFLEFKLYKESNLWGFKVEYIWVFYCNGFL